jgi:UDP-GlcNAc:undecaprenyl-phosphate/decaprenyl-phosphate GlcNAc-1-phosphate transferase
VSGGSGRRRGGGASAAAVSAAVAAGATAAAWRVLRSAPPGGAAVWQRTNHRGEPITLLEGPAFAAGALAGVLAAPLPARTRAAGAVAVTGAAAFGALDDLREGDARKGLRGHLGALARGEVTTGSVKILGIGVTGLLAAALLPPAPAAGGDGSPGAAGRVADVLVGGALVAGCANLLNLLDLRPGRALKVVLATAPLAAGPAAAPLPAAAAAAGAVLLPADLGERAMLGDTGANAAGALLGAALAARWGRAGRLAGLAVVTALTLASEKVSFTAVIESTPVLRELDAAGRRPAAGAAGSAG